MQWLVDVLFDAFFRMIGGTVARLVLPLVSFGGICVESLVAPPAKFNAFGYRRDERGRIEIESRVAGFIGVLIVTVVAIVFGGVLTPLFI
jgi:hypothetical protein